MSAGMAVSSWRTLAALAVGATPNTARLARLRSSAAARRVVVLPVPAGPTTRTRRSWPATAVAASAWRTSRACGRTVVDGDGDVSAASWAKSRIRSSWARTVSWVRWLSLGASHSERPSEARVGVAGSGGSSSTQAATTRSVAASTRRTQSCPDRCDTGGARSQMACTTSARVHVEPLTVSCSTTSARVRLRPGSWRAAVRDRARRWVVQPASAASRRQRGASWADDRWVLVARPSWAARRVRAARSLRMGSRPSRSRNSARAVATASSTWPARLENTASSSDGSPASSAWPVVTGPQATPNRRVSSARSTDW